MVPPTLSDPENVFFLTPQELRSVTEKGCFQLLAVFSMYISFLQEKRLFTKYFTRRRRIDCRIFVICFDTNIFISFSFPASFYGSSHASLPLKDAGATTELSFRFRTSRTEALLVLVAGRIDYLLVMLRNGAVKVRGLMLK